MESLKKIQLPQQVLVGNNLFENIYSILSEFYEDSNIAIICGKKTQELVKEKMIPEVQVKSAQDLGGGKIFSIQERTSQYAFGQSFKSK